MRNLKLKRKYFSLILAILVMSSLILSGCSSAPVNEKAPAASGEGQKVYTIKAYHALMSNAPTVSYFMKFLEDVEKKSEGALDIQIIGGPEAIAPSEALPAIRKGVIDIAYMGGTYYPEIGSLLSIYVYPGATNKIYRESGAIDIMDKMLNDKYGLRYLGSFGGGDSWITISKAPIEKGSYSKLKVRSSAFLNKVIVALDGTPVQTPASDRYAALERGLVDACVVPAQEAIVERLYEAADYAIFPGMASLQNEIWMNSKVFSELPENLQQLFIETSKEWEVKANDEITKEIDNTIKELEKVMTVIRLPEEEAKKFQETTISALWGWMEEMDAEGVKQLKPILESAWEKNK